MSGAVIQLIKYWYPVRADVKGRGIINVHRNSHGRYCVGICDVEHYLVFCYVVHIGCLEKLGVLNQILDIVDQNPQDSHVGDQGHTAADSGAILGLSSVVEGAV
jgi:hypothetical protein